MNIKMTVRVKVVEEVDGREEKGEVGDESPSETESEE